MWRNWQTRRSQKPVMVTSWRFKSSHPHQEFQGRVKWLALLISSVLGDRARSNSSALQLSTNQHTDCSDKWEGEWHPRWPKCFLHSLDIGRRASANHLGVGALLC